MDSRFEQARALFLPGSPTTRPAGWSRPSASSPAPWPWRPAAVRADQPGRRPAQARPGGRSPAPAAGGAGAGAGESGGAGPLRHGAGGTGTQGGSAGAFRPGTGCRSGGGRAVDLARHRAEGTGPAAEAAASFREGLARGGDPELLGYYLAGVEGGAPPATRPALCRDAVRRLCLGLRRPPGEQPALRRAARCWCSGSPPRATASAMRRTWAAAPGCADACCGRWHGGSPASTSRATCWRAGGTGRVRRPGAVRRAGVPAGQRGALRRVLVAADVFIYVGALDEVFAALAQRMEPGGVFAFTVEESTDGDVVLRPACATRIPRRESGGLRGHMDSSSTRWSATPCARSSGSRSRACSSGWTTWLTRNRWLAGRSGRLRLW